MQQTRGGKAESGMGMEHNRRVRNDEHDETGLHNTVLIMCELKTNR